MAIVVNNHVGSIDHFKTYNSVSCFNLSEGHLEKRGIPIETLQFIKNGYSQALENYKKDPHADVFYHQMKGRLEEILFAFEKLPSLLKTGLTVSIDGQRKKFSTEEYLPRLIEHLHCVKTTLLSANPALELVSSEINHILVCMYCKKQKLEHSTFLSIPFTPENGSSRDASLIFINEKNIWTSCIRTCEKEKTQHSLVGISPNRALLIDEKFQPIERPCITALYQASTQDTNTNKMLVQGLASSNARTISKDKVISILLEFTYYTGLPSQNDLPNALTYKVTLQSDGSYALNKRPSNITNLPLANKAEEFVTAYLEWVKEDIIQQFKDDITALPSHLFYMPTSAIEFNNLERQILEEVAKKPEEHVEVIQWLLDTADLPLLEGAPEEELVFPQKAIEILIEAHPPVIEEAKENLGIDSSLVQRDSERKQQFEKAADIRKPKPYNKNNKGKGKLSSKPPANDSKPKTRIVLSSDERSTVRQVYQGHAMKGHDFNKFVLTLLERKVKDMNIRRSGSHINAAQETLVRLHRNGRKDLVGHVSHQKSILREILS